MKKVDKTGDQNGPEEDKKSENPVFVPIEPLMRGESLTGKRQDVARQTLAARTAYLKELKGDIEEITAAITHTDDFNEMRSLLGTKYAIERTLLAEERNIMAEERNLIGERRTRASMKRTELSEKRSGFSGIRTSLAKRRSFFSEKRTIMAQQRTLLAKARTELAFIRTGVAFTALATALMRYFGFGWWTVMDASILIIGILMIVIGVFYYLPIRKQEGGVLAVMRQKEKDLMEQRPKVLIIDDDAGVCDMLKVYFIKSGFDVDACVDPSVARRRLETDRFDVVITDLMMEKMTGVEIVEMIKRVSPETQVIMISYMPMTDHFIKSVRDDLFDYFRKPVDLKALHESVKRAVVEKMKA